MSTIRDLNRPQPPESRSCTGFTLVELLAVVALITLMVALAVPATGILGSAGRKGAVNQLLTIFEQSRVAALESGAPVYLLFWRRDFPERDAYLVVREGTESDADSDGVVPELVVLTRWIGLPKNVIFYSPSGQSGNSLSILDRDLPPYVQARLASLPQHPPAARLDAIQFNESGMIEHPNVSPLALFIAEGSRSAAGLEILTGPKEQAGGLEKFAFSRFTGRASVEISLD